MPDPTDPTRTISPPTDAETCTPDDGPLRTAAYDSSTAVDVGTIIAGKYKLLEEIGEGGMGTVWMAQQTEPIKRFVAVKLIKLGMDSKAVLARFEAERQALALMDHPNIAKVLDAGSTNGRPFFVMELVKGTPITKFCDERKLTPKERLELFIPVCQAIQHAHQKGIIHRDIKPSNVLVALHDDKPVAKVIDFGVAKATGQPLTEKTFHTGFDAIIGTPTYMSPEQATFNQLDIDTRTDVYSLGVLLYELLTGTTPIEQERVRKAALLEVLRVVREEEAPRPSDRLSTTESRASIAAVRGMEPATLSKLFRGELDWIVMKALEKERTRRYETANGLARDIQRYLADEVVEARPPSAGYRLKKFVRRNKGRVAAVAVVLVALVVGVIGTTWGMIRARNSEAAALASHELAEQRLREATSTWYTQVIGVQNELDDQNISPVLRQKLLRSAREKIVDLLKDQPRTREVDHMMHVLHRRLADSSLALGEMDVAEREWAACREIAAARFQDDPDGPDSHRDLGSAHMTRGDIKARTNDVPAALAEFEEAKRLFDAHATLHPGDKRITEDRLLLASRAGNVLVRAGRSKDAADVFRAGLTLARTASEAQPSDVGYARSHFNLCILVGDTALRVEQFKEAQDRYEEALALADRMRKKDPDNLQFVRDHASVLWALGDLEFGRDRMSAARRYYMQALELRQQLADRPGAPPQAFLDVALAFQGLGSISNHTRDYPRAIAEFTEQVRNIRRALSRGDDPARQNYLAMALVRLGWAQQGDHQWAAARQSLTNCLAIRRELREKSAGAAQTIVDEAEAHSYLAFLEREAPFFNLDAALVHSRAGVDLLTPLETAGKFEGQPEWKKTFDTHRQNVAYLEWAVKVLDPVDVVRKRSSPDKALILRAKVTAGRGWAGEAAATAAALAQLPKTPANQLAAARAYALAAAAAGPPAPTDPSAARAVEVLRDWAADGGDLRDIERDPDFAPLTGRADFQKLLGR